MVKCGLASDLHMQVTERHLQRYKKMDFGWNVAWHYARYGTPLPIPMMGKDTWVYRAFNMLLNPAQFYCKHIAEAFHLKHKAPGRRTNAGAMLQTMLLSIGANDTPEEHLLKIAQRTNLSYETLEAFEVLFYNVLDRRDDYIYLADEVYPDSRLVELHENYLRDASSVELLVRAGYNASNIDMPAYLAGIGSASFVHTLASGTDVESELERMIIGNGLVFSHSNLLNQRSVGMSRAQALIVARRQSGQTAEQPLLAGLMPLEDEEFNKTVAYAQAAAANRMRIDAGQTVEV